jgi:hypothetical protein
MSARDSFGALFGALDEASEAELGRRLDAHRAEVLAADGQAYDGELAMLRGLVATIRLAARQDNGLLEVRQLLAEYAGDEAHARLLAMEPAPKFFQPGRIYTRDVHGHTAEFQVRYIDTHPDGSHQRAFGWYRRQPRTGWHAYSQDNTDWQTGAWADTSQGGAQ